MARTHGSRAELTRPRIMEAAKRLIARHGFAAMSMRQLAAETGIQAGTLYTYIPDKQSLLLDLMSSHMQALQHAVEALDLSAQPPEAALEAFTRFHMNFHLDRPEDVFVAYMELRNLEPANFQILDTLRRTYEAQLSAVLARGAAQGVFAIADTAVTTRAIIAMLTGVTTWYRETGPLDRASVVGIYWRMVAGSVGFSPA